MTKTMLGTVHGNVIQLDQDLGVSDGQRVEVQFKVIPEQQDWGAGILRTAGALADDPYWDAIMNEVQQSRKTVRRAQDE